MKPAFSWLSVLAGWGTVQGGGHFQMSDELVEGAGQRWTSGRLRLNGRSFGRGPWTGTGCE